MPVVATDPVGWPAMSTSPTAQMPADHTSRRELIQKKLIVCPISSHEPVSVTFRKKVIVMTARGGKNEQNISMFGKGTLENPKGSERQTLTVCQSKSY